MKEVVLFHPFVPQSAIQAVSETLNSRWIGQGPRVDQLEEKFEREYLDGGGAAIAVSAGTHALHLAYRMIGIGEGDEVIVPLFTCTATNIPLLWERASIRFADIEPGTLNPDPESIRSLVTDRTKAVVVVDYGGEPARIEEIRKFLPPDVPIVEDAAQSLWATHNNGRRVGNEADYTCFSFQAIKHISTGDGGMLVIRRPCSPEVIEKAKRIRWFGIDRKAKQSGTWENDVWEFGYKYQMTDIAAAMGMAGLDCEEEVLGLRSRLKTMYREGLKDVPGLSLLRESPGNSHWLMTALVENRTRLKDHLRERRIEADPVHYRNDRYTLFRSDPNTRISTYPNMDAIDQQYLCLPLHTQMDETMAGRVIDAIREGW